jgi:predicted hotdog family 3-hydroxylacyl-ACP dehydratase
MIVSKEHIQPLIPQRKPFVMIDALLHSDEKITRTTFQVRPENIFVEDGLFREAGLLENIAQTAAARVGYIVQKEKKPAPMGYIGAVKNFEVFDLPRVNEELETEIIITNQIFDITVITGSITCNQRPIARCEMKIFITNHKKNQT